MRRCFLTLLVAVAATACRPMPAGAPSPTPAASSMTLASSLQVEALGDSARLVLQVTNTSGEPLTLTFSSGQTHDFHIRDGAREVWRWSADRMFTQAIQEQTLAAGETRTYAETWRPGAALRGRTLTAVGRLTSLDHPVERTAEFRVP